MKTLEIYDLLLNYLNESEGNLSCESDRIRIATELSELIGRD